VYSRPQLKIYADDVQCNHGSATGQLAEEELFYLRSRGFSKDQAKFMVAYGFAEEIIAGMEPISLRLQLERLIRHELENEAKEAG
jgi:Fe-S cluster assembly protein SufD